MRNMATGCTPVRKHSHLYTWPLSSLFSILVHLVTHFAAINFQPMRRNQESELDSFHSTLPIANGKKLLKNSVCVLYLVLR